MSNIIFTGIQPSGIMHLGNYLGIIKNCIELQNKYKSIFCIVDLHSITNNKFSANKLKNNILKTVAAYVACGINPEKSIIFNQSAVSYHTELSWLLGCYTPIGWLNRMTQFKSKVKKNRKKASLGLYSYPILMASDILLYRAEYVPVGKDQKQHLELTRDIALTFNKHYKLNHFIIPKILIWEQGSKIMSLRDGTSKMSKSDPSEYSRININDTDSLITKKIRKAKTDSIIGFDFSTLKSRPEINNLINIYSILSNNFNVKIVCKEMNKYNMSYFKKNLSDLVISVISPIRQKMTYLLKNKYYLYEILKTGTKKAEEIASYNIKETKNIIGFI